MNKFTQALNDGNYVDGVCCSDCLLWVANNDDSGNSEEWNRTEVDKTLNEFNVTIGDDEKEFSSSRCTICGTDLAGYRMSVILIEWSYLKGNEK